MPPYPGLSWADLTRLGAPGERIALIGTVTDGDGLPTWRLDIRLQREDETVFLEI